MKVEGKVRLGCSFLTIPVGQAFLYYDRPYIKTNDGGGTSLETGSHYCASQFQDAERGVIAAPDAKVLLNG